MLEGEMENSYESLMGIKRYDRDMIGIEFDVQQISSGEIICYHDQDLKRLHNSDIQVSELTDEDVVRYKLPYLREILKWFEGNRYILNIEMKSYDEVTDVNNFCQRVATMVTEFNLREHVIVSSFDACIIMHMLNGYSHIKSALLIYGEVPDETIDNLIRIGLRNIAIDKAQYMNTPKYLSKGLTVMVYTLFDTNDKYDVEIVKYLSRYDGVIFITDRIDKLL
jgi:glycerophosphoryl diester phosphodiesterase